MKTVLYADKYNHIEFDGAKVTGICVADEYNRAGCICGFYCNDMPGRYENGEIICPFKNSCAESVLREISRKTNPNGETVRQPVKGKTGFPEEVYMIMATRGEIAERERDAYSKELNRVNAEYADKMVHAVWTYEKRIAELENEVVRLQCKLIEVNRRNEHD